MIKRLVFDLDNTILPWKNEYYNTLNETFNYFNIDYNKVIIEKLKEAVDNYENEYNIFDRKLMKDMFEKYISIKLPDNFIDIWINFLKKCYPKEVDKDLIDTLEYLISKYELVILTNWFTESQKARLKNINLLKYFKEVIGTDQVLNKPNKESFFKACNPYQINECIMIGDSIKTDIEGAINIGMKAILFDYKNVYNGSLKNIKKLSELKEML